MPKRPRPSGRLTDMTCRSSLLVSEQTCPQTSQSKADEGFNIVFAARDTISRHDDSAQRGFLAKPGGAFRLDTIQPKNLAQPVAIRCLPGRLPVWAGCKGCRRGAVRTHHGCAHPPPACALNRLRTAAAHSSTESVRHVHASERHEARVRGITAAQRSLCGACHGHVRTTV